MHTDAGECAGNTNTQTYSKEIDQLNKHLDEFVQAKHLDQIIMAVMRKTKSFNEPFVAAS